MNATADPDFDCNSFDIEDSADVIGLARSLVNGHHPGILSTVDALGHPQVRWMSTLSFDEFPSFFTLTAADSRKVGEIKAHPMVNWMFFNKDLSLVLNLSGRAQVVEDPKTLKRVWDKIEDKSHAYFLNQYSRAPGFVAIETLVEHIECVSPVNNLKFSVPVGELQSPATVA